MKNNKNGEFATFNYLDYYFVIMTIAPLQIFNLAHKRAEDFLVKNPGKRNENDVRAAVVFIVAAIDAYFTVKIVSYLKSEYQKNLTKFDLSSAAQKLIKEQISKKIFRKEFIKLEKKEKELVTVLIESKKPSVIGYLEDAIRMESFQAIGKIDEAFKIMSKNPQEIWNRVDSAIKSNRVVKKQKMGRPKKNKRGRTANIRVQLENLFKRRHLIVHEADIVLRGRARVGKERQIRYAAVKKWLDYSKTSIKEIDKLIK